MTLVAIVPPYQRTLLMRCAVTVLLSFMPWLPLSEELHHKKLSSSSQDNSFPCLGLSSLMALITCPSCCCHSDWVYRHVLSLTFRLTFLGSMELSFSPPRQVAFRMTELSFSGVPFFPDLQLCLWKAKLPISLISSKFRINSLISGKFKINERGFNQYISSFAHK